ncbi:MAG: YfhO family protein, partial [Clostridiales bacterium]|nr:YfhO family protein [Clostridiales bacterium]
MDKAYLLRYTLLFLFTSFGVFLWFFLTGRTMVWCVDGLPQHYNALVFYGSYLRTVLKTVFIDHSLNIPSWSFSLGEGGDILNVLHYYAIGSPLCVLSVFFIESNMYVLYCFIALFRLYLSGLSFSYLCKVTGQKNARGVLAGALSYAFSFFAVYNAARHLFFLIPVVMLPLIIAGAEKVIRKEKPYLLVISVFLSVLSNIYFFYMMVIMTVVYAVVRVIVIYGKDIRSYLTVALNMAVYSLTGLLMAGVIFFPALYTFLGDTRSTGGVHALRAFYPLPYYKAIPGDLLAPKEELWLCLCFTATCIVAAVLVFRRKKEFLSVKSLLVICAVFSVFPFFGKLFNGMSYITNRWSFAIALLISYVLVCGYDDLVAGKSFYRKIAPFIFGVILIFNIITGTVTESMVIIPLAVLGIFILTMAFLPGRFDSEKNRGTLVLGFTLVSILVSGFTLFSAGGANYAAESRRPSELADYYDDDGICAMKLFEGSDEFHRYSGSSVNMNSSLGRGVSTYAYYWALSNPACDEFRDLLCLKDYSYFKTENMDDRTILTDIGSVLYYIVPEGYEVIPYGYELTGSDIYPGHDIYRNSDPIGICFSSDKLIPGSYWDSLSPSMREESLLQGIVVPDDTVTDLPMTEPELSASEPELTWSFDGDEVTFGEGSIAASVDAALIRASFEGAPGCENHITFENLSFHDGTETILIVKASNGVIKTMDLYEDGYEYYNGRHDYTVNLGYSDEPLEWVVFAFA